MAGVNTISEFGRGSNTAVNPAVLSHLPPGCHVLATHPHGSSFWGQCGRIDVSLPADSADEAAPRTASYFIKTTRNPLAPRMFTSEIASAHAILSVVPGFAPLPIGWGEYSSSFLGDGGAKTYFFLAEFRHMRDDGSLPDPSQFAAKVAALHRDSASPEGRFGFHMATYNGTLPHHNGWEDSWEVFFAESLRTALEHEAKAKGESDEVGRLSARVFEKVIPRLLRPLESEGRGVKPALVHGDLWYGNAGTDRESSDPLVFDACSFYAHNEYELGQWKPVCNRFGKDYVDAYHAIIPRSEPVGDYDGRVDLYKLRFNVHVSALFVDNWGLREQMLGDMKDLVERYGH